MLDSKQSRVILLTRHIAGKVLISWKVNLVAKVGIGDFEFLQKVSGWKICEFKSAIVLESTEDFRVRLTLTPSNAHLSHIPDGSDQLPVVNSYLSKALLSWVEANPYKGGSVTPFIRAISSLLVRVRRMRFVMLALERRFPIEYAEDEGALSCILTALVADSKLRLTVRFDPENLFADSDKLNYQLDLVYGTLEFVVLPTRMSLE